VARVPQLYNLDLSRLTAPCHPLPSLAQGGGWCARAEVPEDGVRLLKTSSLPPAEEGEQPCEGEGMVGKAPPQ